MKLRVIFYLVLLGAGAFVCQQLSMRVSGLGYRNESGISQQVVVNSPMPIIPSMIPSPTIVPSATVDYMSTANVAQATADEARRINAMATVEYVAQINQILQMTANAEQREHEVFSWTVTAALTSIPLTQTQQAAINTQVPVQQSLLSAQLTATKEAPTQIVAMENAQNLRKYGKAEFMVRIFAIGSLGLFCVGLTVFLVRFPVPVVDKTEEEKEEDTVPTPVTRFVVERQSHPAPGVFSQSRFEIPCTPEQFTQFAIKVTQGEKSLAVNEWEGKDVLFTRKAYLPVRAWMREEREEPFVVVLPDNRLAPTDELLNFLMEWIDTQKLRDGYAFIQNEAGEMGEEVADGEAVHA